MKRIARLVTDGLEVNVDVLLPAFHSRGQAHAHVGLFVTVLDDHITLSLTVKGEDWGEVAYEGMVFDADHLRVTSTRKK